MTLKACGTAVKSVSANGSANASIVLPCSAKTGDIIKLFLWNLSDIAPISAVSETTVE